MISIVSVYNDSKVLRSRLLGGLEYQTAKHEVITVDNSDGRFDSAARALDFGAKQANGEWLLFAHQDVLLLGSGWLAEVERMLNRFHPSGWVGVAGMTAGGEFCGLLLDRARLHGAPVANLAEVQTLDECLIIRRRQQGEYFDEAVPGWHAYGVEACCRATRNGEQNYVLSLPVWHDSKSTNMEGLSEAHAYVWHKHGAALHKIFTTCGAIPDEFVEPLPKFPVSVRRAKRWGREKTFALLGSPTKYVHQFGEALELMTKDESDTEVLHGSASMCVIEAKSFVAQPERARRIVHRFCGLSAANWQADCLVVMPQLGHTISIEKLDVFKQRVRRLLVCFDLRHKRMHSHLYRVLQQRSIDWLVARKLDTGINYDGLPRAVAIFDVKCDFASTAAK